MTIIQKVITFYIDGFKNMSKHSRTLWIILLIKLFIMFFVLKIFFFPNFLNSKFSTDTEKGDYVIEQLIK